MQNIDDNNIEFTQDEKDNFSELNVPSNLPTLMEVGVLMIVTFLVILGTSVLFLGKSAGGEVQYDFLIIEIVMMIPAIAFVKYKKYSFAETFRFKPIPPKAVLWTIVTSYFLVSTINMIELLLTELPFPEWYSSMKLDMAVEINKMLSANSTLDLILFFFGVALFAGIFEEMLFRGLLQGALERKYSTILSVVSTAIMFTVLHPANLISIFIFAIILSTITVQAGSILPTILIHIFNNGLSLLALNMIKGDIEMPSGFEASMLPVFIFFILGLSISLKYLFLQFKIQKGNL